MSDPLASDHRCDDATQLDVDEIALAKIPPFPASSEDATEEVTEKASITDNGLEANSDTLKRLVKIPAPATPILCPVPAPATPISLVASPSTPPSLKKKLMIRRARHGSCGKSLQSVQARLSPRRKWKVRKVKTVSAKVQRHRQQLRHGVNIANSHKFGTSS